MFFLWPILFSSEGFYRFQARLSIYCKDISGHYGACVCESGIQIVGRIKSAGSILNWSAMVVTGSQRGHGAGWWPGSCIDQTHNPSSSDGAGGVPGHRLSSRIGTRLARFCDACLHLGACLVHGFRLSYRQGTRNSPTRNALLIGWWLLCGTSCCMSVIIDGIIHFPGSEFSSRIFIWPETEIMSAAMQTGVKPA